MTSLLEIASFIIPLRSIPVCKSVDGQFFHIAIPWRWVVWLEEELWDWHRWSDRCWRGDVDGSRRRGLWRWRRSSWLVECRGCCRGGALILYQTSFFQWKCTSGDDVIDQRRFLRGHHRLCRGVKWGLGSRENWTEPFILASWIIAKGQLVTS